MKHCVVWFAVLGLLALPAFGRPNVVVFLVDDLGVMDIGIEASVLRNWSTSLEQEMVVY